MANEHTEQLPSGQAYRDKMFKLLGDRNPLEMLGQTATTLADIVGKHSTPLLRTRPFEGKWTPNEIIGHLADGEWVRIPLKDLTRHRAGQREPSRLVKVSENPFIPLREARHLAPNSNIEPNF